MLPLPAPEHLAFSPMDAAAAALLALSKLQEALVAARAAATELKALGAALYTRPALDLVAWQARGERPLKHSFGVLDREAGDFEWRTADGGVVWETLRLNFATLDQKYETSPYAFALGLEIHRGALRIEHQTDGTYSISERYLEKRVEPAMTHRARYELEHHIPHDVARLQEAATSLKRGLDEVSRWDAKLAQQKKQRTQ